MTADPCQISSTGPGRVLEAAPNAERALTSSCTIVGVGVLPALLKAMKFEQLRSHDAPRGRARKQT
jgi:hypothetical protein